MQQIFTNNFCEEEIIFQKAHLKPFQIFPYCQWNETVKNRPEERVIAAQSLPTTNFQNFQSKNLDNFTES